ncbi:peptide chain release factor aRF-1 [archaeon]|nr:peptide chain release factor aRF-1 [archaeon]
MDESIKLILLKRKIKELSAYKGQGTQLISLYLPPDVDRSTVNKQLTDEISQSSNIKSAQTRKNVQAALRRLVNYLKQIDFKLPENGLILFSGDVSTNPSKSDVTLIDIEPPKRLTTKLYWCDSSFHIVPLEEMVETDQIYGIIAVDKRETTIAVIRGKLREILGHETSGVPGKTRAGGQSAHRFERLREKAAEDFYKRVGAKVNAVYVPIEGLKGIIVGGPGNTKHEFIEHACLDHRIKDKILGTVDVSYTDESGIKEILDKSSEILKEVGIVKEKKLIEKYISEVAKNNLAIYGFKEVQQAVDYGQVSTVLISEKLEWFILKFKCLKTGEFFFKIAKTKDEINNIINSVEQSSKECQDSSAELVEESDLFDYFLEESQKTSSEVILVSIETPEGKSFLDTFGGIGAFLRYR